MKGKRKVYIASALISLSAVFSAITPAFANQEATVRMHVFNPAGILIKTEKVAIGTKYGDIPEFGQMISNAKANKKWDGAIFDGIYKNGQKVSPSDTVSGDTYRQLPATEVAGLYDSTGQCSLSKCRHTPYPDTARLAALPQKTEQRSARLEGGSLASCHARGSIRFILYRIKDSYEP